MARKKGRGPRSLQSSILRLEEPISDLREGIGSLMAMNPDVAIGDAGVIWIAGKLQEAMELLLDQWRELAVTSRLSSLHREADD